MSLLSNGYRFLLSLMAMMAGMTPLRAQYGTSEAWSTNSSQRMVHKAPQDLRTSSSASTRITLQPDESYQHIDGFGWMLTQGSAKMLMQLPSDERHELIAELYGADGLNASMVRVAIGACDLSESAYTYADTEDETLASFAIHVNDLSSVVPILQEILTINPQVKVLATPWTAPVWMKENTGGHNGFSGGRLKAEYYDLYADYLLRYVTAMAEWGIPVWGISVQNEPLNGHNNPSMTWTKESMYRFIAGNLGPKLQSSDYSTVRIIGYDHNCDVTDFPIYVAKSKYVYGTAFHLYAGDISALSMVYNSTGKPVLFTEQYTGKDGSFGGDLGWHCKNVVLGALANHATTVLEWNLVSDPDYSIHTPGGCNTCQGALTISGSSLTRRNVSYYIIGHASRVMDPGAVRIQAATTAAGLSTIAAANPDGSIGVVIYNDYDQARMIAISLPNPQSTVTNNQSLLYATHSLPASGVLSVRIRPEQSTAVNLIPATSSAVKYIWNGQLVIALNGCQYTILGQKITNTDL